MAAADTILEQMALIDPDGEQRVSLKVHHLSIGVRGDAYVADQHMRKTSPDRFPHIGSFRPGLSCRFSAANGSLRTPRRLCRKSSDFRHPARSVAEKQNDQNARPALMSDFKDGRRIFPTPAGLRWQVAAMQA